MVSHQPYSASRTPRSHFIAVRKRQEYKAQENCTNRTHACQDVQSSYQVSILGLEEKLGSRRSICYGVRKGTLADL